VDEFVSAFCPQKFNQNKVNITKSTIQKLKIALFITTTDIGNNPMVGMSVAVAVAIEEASK